MMKLKKKQFILMLAAAAAIGALAAVLLASAVLHVKGSRVVSASAYQDMKAAEEDCGTLYELRTAMAKQGLYPVDADSQMDAALKAAAASAGDPYTVYMTKKEAKKFQDAADGSVMGIGVFLTEEDGAVVISEIMAKSPAQAAGLKKGDRITAIDGKNVTSLTGARRALAGEKGTTVTLRYVRDGSSGTAKAVRSEVRTASVTGTALDSRTGCIRILFFQKNTGKDFETELQALENQGLKNVIIDIRGNGGGSLSQAVSVADTLLPEGTIARLKRRNGKMKYFNSDENCTDLNYVLLVDSNTASAAELLAAAVKDNGGGKIIGETTYGKGVVQKLIRFRDGSALRLTVQEYFSPDGRKINGVGVKPDIAAGSDAMEKAKALYGVRD